MAQLLPFTGLRYQTAAIGELGGVLCPPYDVISADERGELANDEHNAVHLELPEAPDGGDRYAHAARLLDGWRSSGVLALDERPLVYVYEQAYVLPGSGGDSAGAGARRVARGFFCRLALEEPGRGVLRHERTMSAPKEDRFRLLSAVRANLSPVLLLYRTPGAGALSRDLLDRLTAAPPMAQATARGVEHRMWAADPEESQAAADLLALAGGGPLAIADGHHRYETALRYRDELDGRGAEHVLALLYDADSGGLAVLPTHRVLRGVPEVEALSVGLAEMFELDARTDAHALERDVAAAGSGTLGVWTRHGGFVLRPRADTIAPLLPRGSAALRSLDVVALAAALERVLGLRTSQLDEQGRLVYTKDAGEAVATVMAGDADACFLLNGTPVGAVLEVASARELMPPKSTYFVPKAATGMVFNLLST